MSYVQDLKLKNRYTSSSDDKLRDGRDEKLVSGCKVRDVG